MVNELDFFNDAINQYGYTDGGSSSGRPAGTGPKPSVGALFEVRSLSYPEGIGTEPDLQHYVTFYINIRGKSKMAIQNKNSNEFFNLTQPAAGQNRLDNQDLGKAVPLAVGGIAAIAAAGASFFGGGGAPAGSTIRQQGAQFAKRLGKAGGVGAVAGLAGFGAAKLAQNLDLLKPDQTQRLQEAITLHVDERPSVKYSANYENKELGTLMGALAGGGSATDSTNVGGGGGEAAAFIAMQAAKIPSVVGANQALLLTQLSAKVTTNPFREVFFESIDFRTFNFRYRFYPKNATETKNVQDIINMFKYHMHPELSASGLFYVYPSEFEIKYFYRGEENTNFNKISTCVLTDMQVEYGGEQFSSFRDGSPVEYTMTLTFRELEILTKDRIEKGF